MAAAAITVAVLLPGLRHSRPPAAVPAPPVTAVVATSTVRQAYVLDRCRALIGRLAGSARVRVRHKVFEAVPVA